MARAFLVSQGHKPEDLDAWSYEEQYQQTILYDTGVVGNLPLYLNAWINSGYDKFGDAFPLANEFFKISKVITDEDRKQMTDNWFDNCRRMYGDGS